LDHAEQRKVPRLRAVKLKLEAVMKYKVHIVYADRTVILPQEFDNFHAAATSASPLAKNLQSKAAIRIEPMLSK